MSQNADILSSTSTDTNSISEAFESFNDTSGLPEEKNAYVFTILGNSFFDPSMKIKDMLKQGGYIPIPRESSNNMNIEDLKNMKDVGILYIDSHGEFIEIGGTGAELYAVATSTKVTPELDNNYADDLNGPNPCLVIMKNVYFGKNSDNSDDSRIVYGITENFVKKYMTFGNNSFVFIDSCNSQNTKAFGFVNAFIEKKATYVGWDNFVQSIYSYRCALYLFDRLLGLNNDGPFPKEHPLQRPFCYKSIIDSDMSNRVDSVTGLKWNQGKAFAVFIASLKYTSPSKLVNTNFLILAPSISFVKTDEQNDNIILIGIFGDDKRTMAKVTISENEDDTESEICQIVDWKCNTYQFTGNDAITCKINRDGPGSAGYIQIEIDDRKSNVVPLTAWTGTLTYTIKENGDNDKEKLVISTTINVRFRGDIHKYRLEPGGTTSHPSLAMPSRIVKDSKGNWHVSGTLTKNGTTYIWSDKGSLPPDETLPSSSPNVFGFKVSFPLEEPLNQTAVATAIYGFSDSPGNYYEIIDHQNRYKQPNYNSFSSNIKDIREINSCEFYLHINPSDYSFDKGKFGPTKPQQNILYGFGSGNIPQVVTFEWTKMEAKYPPTSTTKS